ncbi:hypothetical protein HDU91_001076, partial [Kappamyces sp. JEL0680]
TTRYAEPIQNATTALDELNEIYEGELVKFKHAQKDTLGLKDKSEEALKYIEWENQVARLTHTLVQLKSHLSLSACAGLEENIAKLSQVLEEAIQSQQDQSSSLTELEDQLKTALGEVKELASQTAAQNKMLSGLEAQEVEAKETEKFLLQKKKKLAKALEQDRSQQRLDRDWVDNFETDSSHTRGELVSLKDRLEKETVLLEEIQLSLRDKTEVFQKQIEEKQKDLDPILSQVNELGSHISVLSAERDIVDRKVNGGREALVQATATLEAVQNELKQQRVQHSDAMKRVKDVERQFEGKSGYVQELEATKASLGSKASQLRQQVSEAKLSMESTQSRSKVLTSLMAQKNIKGILGRLGDLGTIDAKYDIAITTCCSALDSVVVETVETAQQCIEFLKQSNMGRATFLCLDKLAKHKGMTGFQAPASSQRLFDLVQMKEQRFGPAFYHALSDTLVADNLETANKIAYGATRYRVVTLAGQLIDKSGAMTGGGNRVLKGGMSSKRSSDYSVSDLKKLEAAWEKCEQELGDVTAKHENALLDQKQLEQLVKEAMRTVSRLELEVASLEAQLADAEESFKTAKANSKPDPADTKRLKELEAEIVEWEKKLVEPRNRAEAIQEEIRNLQDEIMQVGGIRLRSQHGKVDSLQDQIASLQKKLAKMAAEKGSREKSLEKSFKALDKREKELDAVDQELEQVQERYSEASAACTSVREQVREANDELESKEDSLQHLKALVSEKTAEMNKA